MNTQIFMRALADETRLIVQSDEVGCVYTEFLPPEELGPKLVDCGPQIASRVADQLSGLLRRR